jgi:hypothetical protein
MWMIPPSISTISPARLVPSLLSRPCTSLLCFAWYTCRSIRIIAVVTASHPPLPTHYSINSGQWHRTYLPPQSLFCPQGPKSRLPLPSSERNRVGHGCEVKIWLELALFFANTIRLHSTVTCASQAWAESHRARRPWTLHRPGGVLERAVSTNTGRMRQTAYHQHEARTIEPSAFGSIGHNPRLRYTRAWYKT